VFNENIPSVYITHQLNVLSGSTSWLTGALHRRLISRFQECWVPDLEGGVNLSGFLGHHENTSLEVKYLGVLSRFNKIDVEKKYDVMILLSGPEPQRTLLEDILKIQLERLSGNVLFVRGVVEDEQHISHQENVTFYNFMTSKELELSMNQSSKLICRSGYTTIMDLASLGKKAYFIPTPGQFEQEYLGRRMKVKGYAPCSPQEEFKIEYLAKLDLYKGIPELQNDVNWAQLFCLFQSKGEF
jgi:uncharacterized protein (TIGR00661 family)